MEAKGRHLFGSGLLEVANVEATAGVGAEARVAAGLSVGDEEEILTEAGIWAMLGNGTGDGASVGLKAKQGLF